MEDNCIVIYDSEDEGSPLTESKRDSVSSDTGCVDPQDIPSNSAKDLQDNASNSDSDLPDIWGSDNESHKDDDVGRDLPSTSTGRVTASRCGKRHIAIKQEYTSLPPAGKGSAVDSESEVEEEEQFGGIGENSSELDGDYNDEGQFRNQTHQNETGNISGEGSDHGDASDSSSDIMTLGVFLKESQSYSQVEPVECKFEDRPWDLHVEDCGSPDAVQSRESPLPPVSSPGLASSIPSRESPLPQVSSPGSASSVPSRESPLPQVSSPGSASSVPSRESPLPQVSSPGSASSVPSRESPLPQVSSPGSASPVPSRESPLPQDHISSGVVRSSDCEADDAVNSDASSTSGTGLHHPGSPDTQFLLRQALNSEELMELKLNRLRLPPGCLSDDGEDEIKSDSCPEPVDKRPKKNQSAIRKSRRKPQSRNDRSCTDEEDEIKSDSCSEPVDKRPEKNQSAVRKSRRKPQSRNDRSCTDEEHQTSCDNVQKKAECGEQSDARRERKVKGKKRCRDRRGQKKTRSGKSRSLRNAGSLQDPESNQDSTNEDCLQEGRSPEQSGNEDRLPPTNPTPMLNGGTEEEPMDTASDEDMNKLRRRFVIRKVPVVSKSETDSDETCIEDDDLDPSSSQAGGIKSEHPNSDETMIDSNDGDDPGRTKNMTSDAVDEVVHNTTTEYFDTQPFSPILHNETEDALSDADEELHTSETIVSRDSPSYLLGDKEHDGREAADLEPNSHVSCQSPDEEIHQPQRDDAGLEPSSSHRSNGVNRPSLQREDDSPGQYFPTDSQLSISLDIEDTEELTTLEDDSQDQYFPTDSQLSISLDDVDTEELTTLEDKGQYFPTDSQLSINLENEDTMSIPSKAHSTRGASKNLDKDSGKKLLPCQRNAWCPSELDPQERFLLLQEGDSEHVSSFSQETLFTPSSPGEAPSTSTAAPGYLLATSNEQHIPKKNKNFQRPSRADKLLTTMKQSDQQKEKNDTKRTDSLQDIPDTPSNTLSLSSKEPSESPSTSMIRSVQDCLQQPASLNSNEMGLEDRLPADSRSLSHGHSSIPSISFPSTSSYSSNISESSRTLNGGHSASSGTSETPSTKPDRLKPTGDDRSACPSDPPDQSLVASDMSKPLKKRRHSQTSSVPSGNQGTEPSKVNQITKEFKQEDVLSCVLSWNADWFDKHKEVHPAEILQSFLMCKEVPKHHANFPDIRSYQGAFLCFLLLEMWSNVLSSVAKDCDRTWRQSSGVNNISGDTVEVQYEAADNPTEPHDLSVGDLVLVDMTTDTASEKQFNFGLVREIGLSDRTICLALHKSIIVPSSTRLKVVTSLSHYLNQIRALLSINSHPLAKHIINPEDSPVFAKDTQVRTEGRVSDDELLNSYMESITSHASRSEVIRLMDGAAGTGKTGFLCRLIQRITRVHKEVPKTFKNPYKLLVCAPTNQSLDVLLRKIWDALMKKMDNAPTGSGRDAMKHIVDGVKIIRVDKAEEADRRLTQFLLSTVMASKRNQGSPYDQLSEDDLQTRLLQEADIVGCTLEDCGLEIVRSSLAGNVFALFVDDASHCLETEILLALQCRTKRVFLAGDQEQGIVSIRSKEARALDFGHSMLERLAENFEIEDRRIHRWEVQYRMKEEIAKYPSSVMYHGLKTRDNHLPFPLRPYIIFDVADGKESLHRDSVVNTSEVSFIEVLVSGFLKLRECFTVGIIAPSEGQKGKLLERLEGKNIPGLVIGTPANFYGLEKDVIILCCTSTSRTPNENGFVMNKQVLNLALTRSKLSLIIVGNMRSLQMMSSNWTYLVNDATDRQLVFRTLQASYSQDAKKCHKETIPSKPSESSSRPEMPLRTVSEGRTPPGQQQRGGQDGSFRRSEDDFSHKQSPGLQDNPAHGSGWDPMEADAVMPAGAKFLPQEVDPGSRSTQALTNEGNAAMFVEEQYWPDAPSEKGGMRRVHFHTGTEDHARAAKVPRSWNYVQGESSFSEKSFGGRSHLSPSSRDPAQPQSILKKPDGNVASTSHEEDRGVGHQLPYNLRSHSPSVASTAPGIFASSSSSTYSPQRQRGNSSGLGASIDPRNLFHGHLSVPSLSLPTRSSYSANISESAALIGGHAASSGTSETPDTKPDRVKPTGDDRSACPSDPPNPSLVASDISKPLKKRRPSQTSSVLSGNQGTEPSKVTRITKEFKQEDVLSCILSWNTDWFDKHKEVHSAEILQSFLTGKEVPRYHACYPDTRSYQEAFICFLLLEMWSNVSSSVAKDCDRTWRQNSGENKISQDIVEVQYEAADIPTEPHGLNVGDLVLVDMTTDTASEKQFNFGLVREIGLTDRTVCLALHKSIIVPSSTRMKVVTSLSHYLNQIRALLSFSSHPLARHIIKPDDQSVFVKDTQVNAEGSLSDVLLNSYMESITSTSSQLKVIRLMIGAAGTGKTAFLCRLVRRIAREHKKVPKTSKNPYKLLVCAPTNQSLDVLLRKIWVALKDVPTGSEREAMKHIVDGVEIVRVDKAKEADRRLTQFFLSTVVASKRKQGSLYDKLSEDDLQTKILQEADIVGCTLEDCGLEIVRSSLAGNVFALVVDDAGHCLETEILLALQCKTKRVFLAGDQEQGIVNIRSKEARALDFGHSMLERLAENFEIEDRRIHRWEIQYRMKEEIAKYPSAVMYSNRLETRDKHLLFCLRPYIIFDVADGKESLHRDSIVNTSEVSFIEVLVSGFLKLRDRFSVGIITPSEGQKEKLLERLQGKNIPGLVVGTPTNFFGLERDVIILCCTSTSRTPNENGFVMNKQVLNLALTRSKYSLIIVGNMRSLQKMSNNWKSLVDDATGRQLVFRTLQASYSKDAKECHSKDPKDSLNVKASSKGVGENRPSRHKHVSGGAGIDNGGKRRVHFHTGTEDHARAAKVPRSCSSVQGESSYSKKSFGGRRNLSPSSRDPTQPDGSLASSSHGEDRGVIVPVHQVHHNLMSHSQSVASTAPGISASSSSTYSPQRQRRNSSGLDASLDTEDGKSLHVIATGMRDNERLPRQQKGHIIAGHTVGKRKPQSSRRMETIEHGGRERRPSGEATCAGTSQRRNRSYRRPQHQFHQQPQSYPERRGQRTVSLNQLDNNPGQLDQKMLYNKTANEAYEGRTTALTKPLRNMRRWKRSNSMQDRQMQQKPLKRSTTEAKQKDYDNPPEKAQSDGADSVESVDHAKEGSSATGTFGVLGGKLSTKSHGFTLHIPPGALEEDETISLQVLTEIPNGLALKEDELLVSHGFQFYPSGLRFKKPAKLIIPHCALVTAPNEVKTILYSLNQSGTPIRLPDSSNFICSVQERWLEVSVSHFSGAFITIIWDWLFLKGIVLSCMPFLPRVLPHSRKPVLEVRFVKKPHDQKWVNIRLQLS